MFDIFKQIVRTGILTEKPRPQLVIDESFDAAQRRIRRIMGRALCIREVDAGSCNACELEVHALNNPYYNLEGLGVKFVASPRHADMLLVTGPVAVNMEEALRRTYEATPAPKYVVAVGACGACGGVFGQSYASRGAVANVIPVDSVAEGCPPTPEAILDAILRAVCRDEKAAANSVR